MRWFIKRLSLKKDWEFKVPLLGVAVVIPLLLLFHPASGLWALGFGPLGVLAAVILISILVILELLFLQFLVRIYFASFAAAPRAMLQIQFVRIAAKFLTLISQILKRCQAFITLLHDRPERPHPDCSLAKLVPPPALPYELFPLTCALLE
jgi:hypothetical protein